LITVFTAVHGRLDLFLRAAESIRAQVPAPFTHIVYDDFSPDEETEEGLKDYLRECPNVMLLHGSAYAPFAPSMAHGLLIAWKLAKVWWAEALLVVESDVVLRPGIIEAFREANDARSEAGAFAPLYTEVGSEQVSSFGGMTEERLDFAGHRLGENVQLSGKQRYADLWWAHLAALWVPHRTLRDPRVFPDVDFPLFYQDHDLSHQMRAAGLSIVLADHAVAEHTRAGASTGLLWGDKVSMVEDAAYRQLKNKWRGTNAPV
jgi:GT2 family glycosyltransferase